MNFFHRTFEHRFLAGKMCGLILFREGYLYVYGLARFSTDKPVFKTWDEAV